MTSGVGSADKDHVRPLYLCTAKLVEVRPDVLLGHRLGIRLIVLPARIVFGRILHVIFGIARPLPGSMTADCRPVSARGPGSR